MAALGIKEDAPASADSAAPIATASSDGSVTTATAAASVAVSQEEQKDQSLTRLTTSQKAALRFALFIVFVIFLVAAFSCIQIQCMKENWSYDDYIAYNSHYLLLKWLLVWVSY